MIRSLQSRRADRAGPQSAVRGARARRPARVERLTLRIIPSQDAERLAVEAGELDLLAADIRPDDLEAMRGLEAAGKVRLFELGSGGRRGRALVQSRPRRAEAGRGPPVAGSRRARAVAHAVDRAAFANTVYLGAAVRPDGPVAPGNRAWYSDKLPRYDHDVPRARQLLAEAGLKDVNGDGIFETSRAAACAIELLTQRGNAIANAAPRSSPPI